jgi:hypothetical protein
MKESVSVQAFPDGTLDNPVLGQHHEFADLERFTISTLSHPHCRECRHSV